MYAPYWFMSKTVIAECKKLVCKAMHLPEYIVKKSQKWHSTVSMLFEKVWMHISSTVKSSDICSLISYLLIWVKQTVAVLLWNFFVISNFKLWKFKKDHILVSVKFSRYYQDITAVE